jgi:hypothetical protein|tara:strand:- start:308 stop:583 length:276 start_codon:yes stop_codon:yes gene_type:complete
MQFQHPRIKFKTNRNYGRDQVITAVGLETGIIFYDEARNITGFIRGSSMLLPEPIMSAYDACRYDNINESVFHAEYSKVGTTLDAQTTTTT